MSDESPKTSKPLYRAEGVTKSERYLHKLAERSFLSLWTYPSLFNDKGKHQELCDLLVVFNNHVLIFSDKDCEFPDTGNLDTDWRRWYKKAIKKSADQVWGAERWIKQHPDRIFLDPACTQPFPLNLPSQDEIIFHRIVVAHGAAARCRKHFDGGSGSLILNTSVVGDSEPFAVGQVELGKGFVHVFDDTSLDVVLLTLDTITDFVMYLTKKEQFLSGDMTVFVTGEEDLLGYYFRNLNEKHEHDFIVPSDFQFCLIGEEEWLNFIISSERKAQVEANEISYRWDALIEVFNKHLIDGTRYSFSHEERKDVEIAHRFLARESRTRRRMLAESLFEVIQNDANGIQSIRYMTSTSPDEAAYVFVALGNPNNYPYEQYRIARIDLLEACCKVFRLEYPHLTDIVGIATELGVNVPSRSEDLLYYDGRLWTEEDEEAAKTIQRELGLLNQSRTKFQRRLHHDFPLQNNNEMPFRERLVGMIPVFAAVGKSTKIAVESVSMGNIANNSSR